MKASVFDMLGPIMVGPSSSHTAGAVRLGLMARKVLGGKPQEARILLHGSFAETGKGHGTHLALTAGLLGMQPDDERIRFAPKLAEEAGMNIIFENVNLGEVHPNSVKFYLTGNNKEKAVIRGASIGGGRIVITEVDEFTVEFTGEYPTLILLYADSPGMIAEITKILAQAGINIAQMRVAREGKGKRALAIIETDELLISEVIEKIKQLSKIERVMFIEPLS
ncbi:MAG TPA: L-serine ammonia-lyase, iron-sulfur-dependent, subunit beta [Peptococcaceae bacterium]|nr:L-serine ammonia-lyase, iron-sulfur-dependent, subunit beta [Peptococcaceae bacterium]